MKLIACILCTSSLCANLFDSLQCARASDAYYAEQYDKAQSCYEKMLVDDPYNKQLIRGVADCLYAKKQLVDAQKYYQQLLLRPDLTDLEHEQVSFNDGCCYAQAKKYKDALTSFEEVVKINKENDRAKKNIEILKKLLEEQKQDKQQNKEQNNDKNQDQQQKEQQKKDQQDQKNQKSDQDQKDQKSDSDSDKSKEQKDDQNRNEQQEKNRQDERNQEGNDQKKQKQPEQQKPDRERDSEPQKQQEREKNQQERHEQEKKRQGEQTKHDQSSKKDKESLQKKDSAKQQKEQLPEQMKAILQQAGEMEKEGQKLYMRALAGQDEKKDGDYAW